MHEYVVLRVGFWLRVMQTGILLMTSHWLKEAPWHGAIAGKVCNVTRAPPAAIPELGCSWRQTSRCWWLCCCSCRQRLQMPRLHCCKTGTDDRLDCQIERTARTMACSPQALCSLAVLQAAVFIASVLYNLSCITTSQVSNKWHCQVHRGLRHRFFNLPNVKSAPAGTSLYETPPSSP